MEGSHPVNLCHVRKLQAFINRFHTILHSTSLAFLFYYRASSSSFLHETTFFPFLLIFLSEAILSFIWLLGIGFRWRPVVRTTFPERLPAGDELPALDVFIFTTDPSKEPTEQVMNTVLSAMALDYPPEKLHVYLSDDGGSPETLSGLRAAWRFARWWVPFCRRYRVKTCCPKLYFSSEMDDDEDIELTAEKQNMKEKYKAFKAEIMRVRTDGHVSGISQDHPSMIEVMEENTAEEMSAKGKLPVVVYVSREKKTSQPHHFKAGALNVLLRVSGVMSNAPYFLVLDCDMMCNDPTSVKQAMCFHLDPNMSPSLAFVQFPQRFRGITRNDIYDSQLRSAFTVLWQGMDGLQGPVLSGTCFYAKRAAFYGNFTSKDNMELVQLQQQFGSSNEFIKSLSKNYTPHLVSVTTAHESLQQDIKLLASCNYETSTKWGQEVGFLYASVVEDVVTGFFMNCSGWRSVFCNPPKPQFTGIATTNLNDLLIQGTRWSSGLIEIALSKFCPLIYGPFNISLLQSLCYAELALFPLYFFPICCFAIIPQLCLLHGIPLYPKVSDPNFFIFAFIFLSAQCKHLQEVLTTGGTFQNFLNEQRMWMIKSTTSHLYGCLNAILNSLSLKKSTFLPTNKEEEEEGQDKEQRTTLYQMDMFDFRTSHMFLVPLLAFLSINVSCFIGGLCRVVVFEEGNWEDMFLQILISGYVIVVNYPIIEGLLLRKDKGRVPTSVVPSFVALFVIIHLGFFLLLRIL
ncbi:cellulose synthase-like protein G2 [Neltuma alba]|uniref:cellulose synthase-like protein G2 n=1 Tax=Neltuma alba TaxID=207710 RepID=UPI0010A4E23A|nr:cellulose synthase-like protein G2 [Prosopis alba]